MKLSTLLVIFPAANLALAAPASIHKRTPSPFFLDITGLIADTAGGATATYDSINKALTDMLGNIAMKRATRSGGGKGIGAAADREARRDNGDSEEAGRPLR